MREHSTIIKWSIFLFALASVSTIYIYLLCGNKFLYDVLLSISGASLMIIFTSIISYRVARKKALENFYEEAFCILKTYSEFTVYYSNDEKIEEQIEGILMLNRISYRGLDREFSNCQFFFSKGEGPQIVKDIYCSLSMARDVIIKDIYHLELHKRGKGARKVEVLSRFIDPVYNFFFITNDEGVIDGVNVSSKKSEYVKELGDKLNKLHMFIYNNKESKNSDD